MSGRKEKTILLPKKCQTGCISCDKGSKNGRRVHTKDGQTSDERTDVTRKKIADARASHEDEGRGVRVEVRVSGDPLSSCIESEREWKSNLNSGLFSSSDGHTTDTRVTVAPTDPSIARHSTSSSLLLHSLQTHVRSSIYSGCLVGVRVIKYPLFLAIVLSQTLMW